MLPVLDDPITENFGFQKASMVSHCAIANASPICCIKQAGNVRDCRNVTLSTGLTSVQYDSLPEMVYGAPEGAQAESQVQSQSEVESLYIILPTYVKSGANTIF